jgi:hypothetical protein
MEDYPSMEEMRKKLEKILDEVLEGLEKLNKEYQRKYDSMKYFDSFFEQDEITFNQVMLEFKEADEENERN